MRATLGVMRSETLSRMAALEARLTRRMLYYVLATVGTILTFMRLWMAHA